MNQPLNTVTVIGGGTMGRGIAYASCLAGYQTKLYDVSNEVLQQAGHYVLSNFQKATSKGVITEEHAAKSHARLPVRRRSKWISSRRWNCCRQYLKAKPAIPTKA